MVRGEARFLLAISLANGFSLAGLTARALVIPLRVRSLGGDPLSVGLVMASSTILAALVAVPAGMLGARFSRKVLVSIGLLVCVLAQVGSAISGTVAGNAVWQAFGGIGSGGSQVVMFGALATRTSAGHIGRAFGLVTSGGQVGSMLGPMVAGWFASRFGLSVGLECSAGFYLLALLSIAAVLASGEARVTAPARSGARRTSAGVVVLRAKAALLSLVCISMLWGIYQSYIPVYAQSRFGVDAAIIGVVVGCVALTNALARALMGRMLDRIRVGGNLAVLGLSGFAVGLGMVPLLPQFAFVAVALVLTMPFVVLTYVSSAILMTSEVGIELRAFVMGVYNFSIYFGSALGPLGFGAVFNRFGFEWGFGSAALLSALVATTLLAAGPLDRRIRGIRRSVRVPRTQDHK